MKNKKILLTIIFLTMVTIISGCNKDQENELSEEVYDFKTDPSNEYVVFKQNEQTLPIDNEKYERIDITQEEAKKAIAILKKYSENIEALKDFKEYKLQLAGLKNKEGEKLVWINSFCDHGDKDWKRELVIVQDGGSCYFNAKINIQNADVIDFIVNGKA